VAKYQDLDVSNANTTNTKLSMLASSLFNSIKGIESSHCINTKSGDVEIGGIGISFVVQDSQDA
jgi:hypothetical protein